MSLNLPRYGLCFYTDFKEVIDVILVEKSIIIQATRSPENDPSL